MKITDMGYSANVNSTNKPIGFSIMNSLIRSRIRVLTMLMIAVLLPFFSGCAVIQTDVVGESNLKSYKRAYVVAIPVDEFQIYPALFSELTDMGMQVVANPFTDPEKTDLIVNYSYDSGWDMSRYLQSFQFQFIDAKSRRVIAIQTFKSRGIWLGVRNERLKSAFNSLRAKNGYPPSKQFP